jgi:DNA-binding CsgD family transcriptional regulator
MNYENREVGEILDNLIDESTSNEIELMLLIDILATRLTRRQALIVRLILLGVKSQVEISKILGFSTPTINLDMQKIKSHFVKIYKEQGYNILKISKVKIKKDVFILGGTDGVKGIKGNRETKEN